MAKIILIFGTPGVGKSSLLKHPKLASNARIVNFGKEMLRVASLPENERDLLRKKPVKEQQDIAKKAAENIANLPESKVLVDTHAMIQTPHGFIPGTPLSILKILQPKKISLIIADPKIIFERRSKDKKRSRDQDSIEAIAFHQSLILSFATTCSVLSGAMLTVIENNESLETVAKNLQASF